MNMMMAKEVFRNTPHVTALFRNVTRNKATQCLLMRASRACHAGFRSVAKTTAGSREARSRSKKPARSVGSRRT